MSSEDPEVTPPPAQSSRKRKTTEKQRAIDEESLEDAKKKIKSLETQVKDLVGMNDNLRGYVREKFGEHKSTGGGEGAAPPEPSANTSPTIFTAKKVTQKGKANATPSGQAQQSTKGSPVTARRRPQPSRKNVPQPPPHTHAESPIVGVGHDTGSHSTPEPGEPRPLVGEPPRPWPPAPFAPGVNDKKTKTANKEYDDVVARMLSTTEHDFENRIFTEDGYPDLNTQVRWSIECWEDVCREENHYYGLSNDMRNLIKSRCSHARGAALAQVRPIVESLFNSSGRSRAVKKANEGTHNRLLEANAFYYKDVSRRTDQFKNEDLRSCIQKVFFSGDKGELVRYKNKFNPIPLPSIALICTLFEHCIREWSTGVQTKTPLDEARDRARYKTHVENVRKWAALKSETTTNIRKQMFKKFISVRGIDSEDPEASKGAVSDEALAVEREALEGQTGLTDSEPEDEH